jgi:hypothetical protein
MNPILSGVLLLLSAVFGAGGAKPLPKDDQINLLKVQRQIQHVQIQMADLQRQYEQAANTIKQLQTQMETECNAAAEEANVDLAKFTCDLDTLTFVAKPAPAPKPTPPSPSPK